jgi:hypothetical protein
MTFNINTLSRSELIAQIVNSEIELKENLEFLLCDYFATFSTEDLKGIFIDHELHLSHIHADSYIETENTMRGSL